MWHQPLYLGVSDEALTAVFSREMLDLGSAYFRPRLGFTFWAGPRRVSFFTWALVRKNPIPATAPYTLLFPTRTRRFFARSRRIPRWWSVFFPTHEKTPTSSCPLFTPQAVQSLDETINDIFGGDASGNNLSGGSQGGGASASRDGWVELRGGAPAPVSALLDPEAAAAEAAAAAAAAAAAKHGRSASWGGTAMASVAAAAAGGGAGAGAGTGRYPGAFVMGNSGGRRGGAKGRGRVFGVPLEDLVLNPDR